MTTLTVNLYTYMYCKSDPDPPISSNNCLALLVRCLVLTSVSNAVITQSMQKFYQLEPLNFLKPTCKTALKKYCQASFGDMIPIP